MCIIAPSLLEADYGHLETELKKMKKGGADYVHIDVMDGCFVPNLSFGMKMIKGLRDSVDTVFDVHMMVMNPERFIHRMADAGADVISVHLEACENIIETLDEIHACGRKAGIVLNPETDFSLLTRGILDRVEVIQVMTVAPGIEGQEFRNDMIAKINLIRNRLREMNYKIDIEVDGGINFENVQSVVNAGASIVVSGKALFTGNLEENIQRMKQLAEDVEGNI